MLRSIASITAISCSLALSLSADDHKKNKPNVLIISIDDLNDWVGCLGGHPQVKTPNIDALAKRGTLFTNAYCQSPVCNPSRTSMMYSKYPSTSGIYFLSPPPSASEKLKDKQHLFDRFKSEGYHVAAAGKLFHNTKPEFENYGGTYGGFGPVPKKKISPFLGHPLWDWGVYPPKDEEMPDYKVAAWAHEELQKKHDKPFCIGVGFYRPHVPQFAPKKWFDMYPEESVKLPVIKENDLDDLSPYAISLTRDEHVAPTHDWVVENKQWVPLVHSYLACVSFVDYQVGKVLKSLEQSDYADNTIIVLFSDHGFHLGEKERWAKRSLWNDSVRVPLIISAPHIKKSSSSDKPTELIDVYPTLLELAGISEDKDLEGNSLVPLMKSPDAEWPNHAFSNFGPGNYAISSETHRYICYNDGSEELYHRKNDPHEWENIAKDPANQSLLETFRKLVPTKRAPILGKRSTGHKAFSAAEAIKLKQKK